MGFAAIGKGFQTKFENGGKYYLERKWKWMRCKFPDF